MKPALALFTFCLAVASVSAQAQTAMRIRGTVTSYESSTLAVKTREGKDLNLKMTDATAVSAVKAIALTDLKPGDYVGTTSVRNAEGKMVAREVHIIPASAAAGQRPWDLEPNSTMTNANVAKTVKSTNGHELTVEYTGGSQTILVPDGTPVVTTIPGDRTLLKPGSYVVITAEAATDGIITAQRIQATKDGVKPPQ